MHISRRSRVSTPGVWEAVRAMHLSSCSVSSIGWLLQQESTYGLCRHALRMRFWGWGDASIQLDLQVPVIQCPLLTHMHVCINRKLYCFISSKQKIIKCV